MVKTAVITGASAGIGLALADRLLTVNPDMVLCLACRNPTKAEACREGLLLAHPKATVETQIIDVGDVKSVYKAVSEIKQRYHSLDYIYLNAGIMPDTSVNWNNFLKGFFSRDCFHMFSTGHGLLMQKDRVTQDGLQQIFATNVFGHFILVKHLEDLLAKDGSTGQIIWTGSSNAKQGEFKTDDIQHKHGCEAYSSSKYACDLISYKLNENLNKKGIYSHVTCPGLVMSNLTHGILPAWIWMFIIPFLWIMRLFLSNLTLTPYNGTQALYWLSEQNPAGLDPMCKYHSSVTVFGDLFIKPKKMDLDLTAADRLYRELNQMEREFNQKYTS